MTVEEIVINVNNRLQDNIYPAIIDVHSMMTERMFEEYKDRNGNAPKPYDTKPIYVSNPPRKSGEKKGKTYYYEGGYAQLKKQIGEPPLRYTGNLFKDFSTGLVEVDENTYRVVVSDENVGKLERYFPEFPKHSKEELDYLLKRLVDVSN